MLLKICFEFYELIFIVIRNKLDKECFDFVDRVFLFSGFKGRLFFI